MVRSRSRKVSRWCSVLLGSLVLTSEIAAAASGGCIAESDRVRARQLGIAPGVLPPGPLNAITDVAGVLVGQTTLIAGDSIRAGATAILPHGGNLYQSKVPAAVFVFNGFGKSAGLSQVAELGEIETPIVLTNTLSVATGMEAILDWTLAQPGNEKVMSVNAVVGETNDGHLNDIRRRALTSAQILDAIKSARSGPVEEGAVGAGTGTVAFGWKGGIGTSSRRLPSVVGGWTVGVLVQTNFGGALTVDGRRIGEELGRYARTGSSFSNGSDDYVVVFSVAQEGLRTAAKRAGVAQFAEMSNDSVSPLFQAVAEATEQAIYNSLLMATTTRSRNAITGQEVVVERLPLAPFLKSRNLSCR